MTRTSPPPFAKLGESIQQINQRLAETMDRLRRTVTLMLPHPTETLGDRAAWVGESWRVALVDDQIHVTGGCAIGETEQVAAAMLAADQLRARRAAGQEAGQA